MQNNSPYPNILHVAIDVFDNIDIVHELTIDKLFLCVMRCE